MADEEFRSREEVHTTVGDPVPGESYVEQDRVQRVSWYRNKLILGTLALIIVIVAMIWWAPWKRYGGKSQAQGKPPIEEIKEYLAKAKDKLTPSEERDLGFAMIKESKDRDQNIQVTEENLKLVGVDIVKRCPDEKPVVRTAKKAKRMKVVAKSSGPEIEAAYRRTSPKECGPPFCP